MGRVLLIFFFALVGYGVHAQQAKVVQLEHSLRWASELNFPNFLSDAQFEELLLDETGDRLSVWTGASEIQFPAHFDYRLIGGFGKTKVKMPRSGEGIQIAIASSITRATVGYNMLWSMQVIIKKNGKTLLDKEVEHEIEPYSMSIRMSTRPWLEADEFLKVYLMLLDECLGNREYKEGLISFGSIEIVRKEIEKIIPISHEYRMAVAGAMMAEADATYQLFKDTVVLHDYFYRDKEEWDFNLTFAPQSIFPSIFSQITGIETYYKLESKEKRFGTLTTNDGIKRRLRLDWLAELRKSAVDNSTVDGQVISPITGQFFEKDSLISHFIVYSRRKPIEQASLRDAHFQQGDNNFAETEYTVVGTFRGRPFMVSYHDVDARVLISIEDKNVAVLSLINANPESLSAGGVRMTKNKRFFVTSGNMKKPKLEVGSAEWYPFYVVDSVDNEAATEMGFILILLFFAVGQTG